MHFFINLFINLFLFIFYFYFENTKSLKECQSGLPIMDVEGQSGTF